MLCKNYRVSKPERSHSFNICQNAIFSQLKNTITISKYFFRPLNGFFKGVIHFCQNMKINFRKWHNKTRTQWCLCNLPSNLFIAFFIFFLKFRGEVTFFHHNFHVSKEARFLKKVSFLRCGIIYKNINFGFVSTFINVQILRKNLPICKKRLVRYFVWRNLTPFRHRHLASSTCTTWNLGTTFGALVVSIMLWSIHGKSMHVKMTTSPFA